MENKDKQKFMVKDKVVVVRVGRYFLDVGKVILVEPKNKGKLHYRVYLPDRSTHRFRADEIQDIGYLYNVVQKKVDEARSQIKK